MIWLAPIWQPSAILRGAWAQDPFQPIYLKRAKAIAEGHEPHVLEPNEPPPGALLDPTPAEMWHWYGGITSGDLVAVDIEAAGPHITCIGMCRLSDLVAIVFRFRNCGGLPELEDIDTRIEICDLVLARKDVGLVFQNGQAYDIPQLELSAFVVEGYWDIGFDTMLGGFCCYPDPPKDLQFLACVYGGFSPWKHTVKAEVGENK